MTNKRTLPLLLIIALLLCTVTCCSAAEMVLVVNKNNPLSSISRHTAKLIFLGKKTKWSFGEHITVSVNNSQELYASFCRDILKKTPQQYILYRKKMLFSGTGIPPLVKENDKEVKSCISGNENAIGFIEKKSLDSQVKQLHIH